QRHCSFCGCLQCKTAIVDGAANIDDMLETAASRCMHAGGQLAHQLVEVRRAAGWHASSGSSNSVRGSRSSGQRSLIDGDGDASSSVRMRADKKGGGVMLVRRQRRWRCSDRQLRRGRGQQAWAIVVVMMNGLDLPIQASPATENDVDGFWEIRRLDEV
ncbi:hypothetical protein ACLOJK_004577, partial [Asimina triloba]